MDRHIIKKLANMSNFPTSGNDTENPHTILVRYCPEVNRQTLGRRRVLVRVRDLFGGSDNLIIHFRHPYYENKCVFGVTSYLIYDWGRDG